MVSATEPVTLRVAIAGEHLRLRLHADDFVSNIIRRDGFWELPQTGFLMRSIKPADVVLDIGANLGYYTVVAAKLATRGVVHAFEPDPDNFALLRENCALNGCANVVLHNTALASAAGTAPLYLSKHNKGDHRLASSEAGIASVEIVKQVGDELLHALPRVDFVKCDTQGAEGEVFAGLLRLIERSVPKPLMLVEFEPLGLSAMGNSYAELLDCFDRWGYAYHFVYWENIFPIRRSTLVDLAEYWLEIGAGGNLDLVLVPR